MPSPHKTNDTHKGKISNNLILKTSRLSTVASCLGLAVGMAQLVTKISLQLIISEEAAVNKYLREVLTP